MAYLEMPCKGMKNGNLKSLDKRESLKLML